MNGKPRESRRMYLAEWRRKNRHAEWLHARDAFSRRLERIGGGKVTILGVRVDWKAGRGVQ